MAPERKSPIVQLLRDMRAEIRRADRRAAARGIEYHTTVIGHGVLIGDLEGRLRRVEQHLNLA